MIGPENLLKLQDAEEIKELCVDWLGPCLAHLILDKLTTVQFGYRTEVSDGTEGRGFGHESEVGYTQ